MQSTWTVPSHLPGERITSKMFDKFGAILVMLMIQICSVMTKTTGTVTVNCVHQGDVKISYVGAAQGVLAVNKADKSCFFSENTATASYELIVGLTKQSSQPCYMDKSADMDIYTITVQGRLLHKDFEDLNDEEFLIQCNFEPFVNDITRTASVIDTWSQPSAVDQAKSVPTKSKFAITFVRIDGTPFPGSVSIGRKMRLQAKMTAAPGDKGFKPVTCKTSSTDGKKTFVLLVNGCGVGKPWGYNEGFTTKGTTSVSPVLKLFRLVRGQSVIFSCDFIMCKGSCDGSSCSKKGRRKRWVEDFKNTTLTAVSTISPMERTKNDAIQSTLQMTTVKKDLNNNQATDSNLVRHTVDHYEKAESNTRLNIRKFPSPTNSSGLINSTKPPKNIGQDKANQHRGTTGRMSNNASAEIKYRSTTETSLNYKIINHNETSYETLQNETRRNEVPAIQLRELNSRNVYPALQHVVAGIIVDVEKIEAKTSIILDLTEAEIENSDHSGSRQETVNDGPKASSPAKVDNIGDDESRLSSVKIEIVILAMTIVIIFSLGFVILCLKKVHLNSSKGRLLVAT